MLIKCYIYLKLIETFNENNFLFQVTFFSKHGNEETLSQIDSQNMNFSLPDHVLAPTIWVCCKRIDARALKEAMIII